MPCIPQVTWLLYTSNPFCEMKWDHRPQTELQSLVALQLLQRAWPTPTRWPRCQGRGLETVTRMSLLPTTKTVFNSGNTANTGSMHFLLENEVFKHAILPRSLKAVRMQSGTQLTKPARLLLARVRGRHTTPFNADPLNPCAPIRVHLMCVHLFRSWIKGRLCAFKRRASCPESHPARTALIRSVHAPGA